MAPKLTTLPSEVLRRIARFLAGDEIWRHDLNLYFGYENAVAQYTTISKKFKEELEPFTFKYLHLTPSRLPQVAVILTASRLKLLHRIVFDIVLPSFTLEACYRLENDAEKARNSRIVDQEISTFFEAVLGTWKKGQVRASGLELSIRAFAPSDSEPNGLMPTIDEDEVVDNYNAIVDSIFRAPGGMRTESFEGSFLELSTPLPQAECVSDFSIGQYGSTRNFSAHSYWALLQAVPNVQRLQLRTYDIQNPEISHRKAYIGFLSSLPPAIEHLYFAFTDFSHNLPCRWPAWDTDYLEYIRQMTEGGQDVLSCTLRQVSRRLTTLRVRGPIGSQFFWPPEGSQESTPYWPNLKFFGAFIYFYLPGGTWLFEHVGGSGDGEICDKCEWKVNEDGFNELYSAVAKSVQRMPKLEIMALRIALEPLPFHDFRFQVVGRRAYLGWRSTPIFRPSDEVLDLWKKVADSRSLELDVVVFRAKITDLNTDYIGESFVQEFENDKYRFGREDECDDSELDAVEEAELKGMFGGPSDDDDDDDDEE